MSLNEHESAQMSLKKPKLAQMSLKEPNWAQMSLNKLKLQWNIYQWCISVKDMAYVMIFKRV